MDKKEALERIKIIKKEAHKLQKIIDAPEKPEPRHGDFGSNVDGNNRIVLFQSGEDGGQRSDYGRFGIHSNTDIKPFGNIFDLLKEWSEKPESDFLSSQARGGNSIRLGTDDEEIWMGNVDNSDWYSYKAAYKIWIELGKRLACLKRKENQND